MPIFRVKFTSSNGIRFDANTYIVKASNALEASDKVFGHFKEHSSGDTSIINNELDITEIKDTDILYTSRR